MVNEGWFHTNSSVHSEYAASTRVNLLCQSTALAISLCCTRVHLDHEIELKAGVGT